MKDTTMVVMFFRGKDRVEKIQIVKRVAASLVEAAYDADFTGVPSVHAEDAHGNYVDWEMEAE